ncbi:MAG: hypothetical protein NT145_06695 [Elusimicrobia bacterium]|nr:hypothetical protein [Elusimicrobiota bacterium]
MIKNIELFEKFQRQLLKTKKYSYGQALKIYENLHKEAVFFGAISSKTILEGIEVDKKIAKMLNGAKK